MHSSSDTLRMVLADNSAIVRAGIKRMLSEKPGIEIVEELTDAKSTITAIRDLEPDVVMLEFYLNPGSAVDVLGACRMMERRPICIVLTQHTEPSVRAISYAAGADIFYDKGRDIGPLFTMLRKFAVALQQNVTVR